MKKREIISQLIEIADELDDSQHYGEANIVTKIANKIAQTTGGFDEENPDLPADEETTLKGYEQFDLDTDAGIAEFLEELKQRTPQQEKNWEQGDAMANADEEYREWVKKHEEEQHEEGNYNPDCLVCNPGPGYDDMEYFTTAPPPPNNKSI